METQKNSPEIIIKKPDGTKIIIKEDILNLVSPLSLGAYILQLVGCEVEMTAYAYNSLRITVRKDGEVIYQEAIGN